MATKALVTCANGAEFEKMLAVAMPSFEEFADLHGYDLLVEPSLKCDRPPSWHKVPILLACLEQYDEAVWVDVDMVIVDPSEDFGVPADAWQALVQHHTADGDVPNCGLWVVRQPMREWLVKVWEQTRWMYYGWWEQAALMELMGYRVQPFPARLVSPTPLYDNTFWLDHGWNYHRWDSPGPEHVRIAHATMFPDRFDTMVSWARDGVPGLPGLPCNHRYKDLNCMVCMGVAA